MTDNLPAVQPSGQSDEQKLYNPYELLGKPTLELTDAELEAIVVELRARRRSFLLGQQDKNKPKKIAAPKVPAIKAKIDSSSLLDDL